MNRVARMMLMANRQNGSEEYRRGDSGRQMEYRHGDGRYDDYGENRYHDYDYGIEDRFRDRQGREHYDDGRYAPQNIGDYDVESRSGRDRVNWGSEPYRGTAESRYEGGNVYPMRQSMSQPKRKIGFSIGGEMERLPEGTASIEPFTRHTAEEWVSEMQNSDGTTGQHWTLEQAQQLMTQRKISCDPVRFYTALNAVYSDFGAVAKKHGVSNVEFFADLAKAWLDDKDAVPDKLEAYYEYVVKH